MIIAEDIRPIFCRLEQMAGLKWDGDINDLLHQFEAGLDSLLAVCAISQLSI
jgi:hypothetical protein